MFSYSCLLTTSSNKKLGAEAGSKEDCWENEKGPHQIYVTVITCNTEENNDSKRQRKVLKGITLLLLLLITMIIFDNGINNNNNNNPRTIFIVLSS